jgi:hypothetical protein
MRLQSRGSRRQGYLQACVRVARIRVRGRPGERHGAAAASDALIKRSAGASSDVIQ